MKYLYFYLAAALALLSSCQQSSNDPSPKKEKPLVYTTLFLTYDFARAIAGDRMHVELFLPAGIDTHSYEPSAADMLKAKNADLFLWTSSMMEPWMPKITDSLQLGNASINLADKLHLHSLNPKADDDEHTHDHPHHGHDHDGKDPHFWMNPELLVALFDVIVEQIIQFDPAHTAEYQANAEAYKAQLLAILGNTQTIVENGQGYPLLFGGGFSQAAFLKAMQLEYATVYHGDSLENEPTIAHMASIRQLIIDNTLRYIFVDPMLSTKIAATLAGDHRLTLLPWHTGHTLSQESINAGVSYLDLLQENNDNLALALNNQPPN
jgi:zinc transport system substrate-binding protein